jgi:hypothetical protein
MARLANHRRSPTAKGIGAKGIGAKAIGRFRDPQNPDEASPFGGGRGGGNFCEGCVIEFSHGMFPWFPFPGVRVTIETPDESQGNCEWSESEGCIGTRICRPNYTVVVENTGSRRVLFEMPVLYRPILKKVIDVGAPIRRFLVDETNPPEGEVVLSAECGALLAGHSVEISVEGGKPPDPSRPPWSIPDTTIVVCSECEIAM